MVEWDVVVIGGINTDYVVRAQKLPRPGESMSGGTFLEGPGGKGGNTAVAAARLGARTAIIGRVGNDVRGHGLLRQLDVVRANAGEVEALTGVRVHDRASARDGARALLARGVQAVFVEAGEGNLLVWQSGERSGEEWLPELPVKRVDATGAGDALSGALAVTLAEGRPLPDAGRFASATAALATRTLGAQSGLPRRHELEAYLNKIDADSH